MSVRTHRRRNFKKRTNVRNRTKRNTRRNTKRRLNRRIKRTKRNARMRGGDKDYWVKKSDRREAEEAVAETGENLKFKTNDNGVKQYYDPRGNGKWVDDAPKGMATKLAMRFKGQEGVDAVRSMREGTKPLGRAAKKVGEGVAFTIAAADSVMH